MSSAYEQVTNIELNGDIENTGAIPERPERYRPPVFLIGVALLTLFFTGQILQIFPALGQLQFAKIVTLAAIILFLSSRQRISSRIRLRNAPQLKYLVCILAL